MRRFQLDAVLVQKIDGSGDQPGLVELSTLARQPPPEPRRWLVRDWLPAGARQIPSAAPAASRPPPIVGQSAEQHSVTCHALKNGSTDLVLLCTIIRLIRHGRMDLRTSEQRVQEAAITDSARPLCDSASPQGARRPPGPDLPSLKPRQGIL